jgi:hypothetical protein
MTPALKLGDCTQRLRELLSAMPTPRNEALVARLGPAIDAVIAAHKLARDLRDPSADRSAASELHARISRAEGALSDPPLDIEAHLADALRQARLAATPEHLGEAVAALTRAATDYDKATLME